MWVNILSICAGILLVEALLILGVGWRWHLSWRVRYTAVISLAASAFAVLTAHHLYDTYASWRAYLHVWLPESHVPESTAQVVSKIASANREATALGWVGIIVTSILLVLGLVGGWHLVVPRQRRESLGSMAVEP
jgi:hypothetical protein